jgi:phage shock protein E
MKKLLIISLLLVVFAVVYGGCDYVTGAALTTTATPTPTITNVTPEQAYKLYMISAYKIQLIDVRTSYEYAAGHIDDAINVDVSDPYFRSNIEKLPRDQYYIVYCTSGVRSAAASKIMLESGFLHIYNIIDGGFSDLAAQGFPVEQ